MSTETELELTVSVPFVPVHTLSGLSQDNNLVRFQPKNKPNKVEEETRDEAA